ncbi:MAG TPA: hypothetical protein VHR72_11650, partial [Gemmataceae bacterium]|nr:hypothetical protein [Gemmataceae bacterium]
RFDPEYAEIFGVPFKFIPCSGMKGPQPPPVPTTRVRFVPERVEQHPALDIVFPRVTGYRYELGAQRLQARFDADSRFTLSTRDIPTRVENAPLIGKVAILTLDDLRARRPQEIAFNLARLMMERFFASDPILADAEAADTGQIALFPQLLVICRRWLESSVDLKDGAFKQMLLLSQFANRAAEKIYRAIVEATPGEKRLRPSLVPMDPLGDAHGVSFDTRRDTWQTKAEKSPISHVALDSDWEAKFAQTLEESDAVRAYVKNDKVGFKIPYVYEGLPRNYYPDYLVRVEDGGADLLNLIVEVSGQREDDKQAKVDTARKLWVPAVNGEGRFGRWAFLEVTDPWKVEDDLRRYYTK